MQSGLPDYEPYGQNANTHPPKEYSDREVFNRDARGDFELFLGPARKMAQYAFIGAATPLLALPANNRRAYLIVQNKSAATNLFIGFGAGIDITNGLLILPNGGNLLADENVPTDDIYIFFTAGAAQLCVICEGVYQS